MLSIAASGLFIAPRAMNSPVLANRLSETPRSLASLLGTAPADGLAANRRVRLRPRVGNKPRDTDRHRPRRPDAWFQCVHCRQPVGAEAFGTDHRNHCPSCLWSKHVDDRPGDRAAECDGAMEPIAVWVKPGGEWSIVHRCRRCAALHANRIAGDDNELVLTSLAVRPLSLPSFPLERLAVLDIRRTPPDAPAELTDQPAADH